MRSQSQTETIRSMVEVSPAALVVMDRMHRFVYVNPAACEIFDRKTDELLGKDFAAFIVERERDEATSYLNSLAAPGGRDARTAFLAYELRGRRGGSTGGSLPRRD